MGPMGMGPSLYERGVLPRPHLWLPRAGEKGGGGSRGLVGGGEREGVAPRVTSGPLRSHPHSSFLYGHYQDMQLVLHVRHMTRCKSNGKQRINLEQDGEDNKCDVSHD